MNVVALQNHVLSSVCSYKLTETRACPILPYLPKEIPTTAVSHHLALSFLTFYQLKLRNHNIIVSIVKIMMMVVAVIVRIIVVGVITTTITHNGGFRFLECLECMGTVLSLLYASSYCNNPLRKMFLPYFTV